MENTSNKKGKSFGVEFSYNLVIYAIMLFILLIGLIIFFIYPLKILKYTYVPFTIFYLLVTFSVLIYIIVYTTKRNENRNLFEFLSSFSGHAKKLFIIIFLLLCISFVIYYFTSGIKSMFKFLLRQSFWFSFGLIIILLAILNQYTQNYQFNNKYINLIKNIILYIPCILTDTIEYLKQDYANTPSTVMILFFILIVFILLYVLVPIINYYVYKSDGLLLISKPVYLNTNVLMKTRSQITEEIFNSRPFYDRWTQEILNKTVLFNEAENTVDNSSFNNYFGSQFKSDIHGYTEIIIPDEQTKKYYENFTSAQGEDSLPIINSLNFLNLTQQNLLSKAKLDNPEIENKLNELVNQPEDLKEYVMSIISENPQLLSIHDKLILIANNFKSVGVATAGIANDFAKKYMLENDLTGNLYHYSITFWIYLNNSSNISGKQTILTYGNRPSLYFDGTKKELLLEMNKDEGSTSQKVLYKTTDILYQRWNHIVMNYNYGTFDLFINNNLVGTFKNISPRLYSDEMLIVGSVNNNNLGGICNMKYYELPLPLSKIEKIYTQFHKKNPPI